MQTFDLLDGLARRVNTAGLATYRSDDSEYLPTETAVLFAFMPQSPDRCIVLTDYTANDNPSVPLGQIRVQARFRGLPNQPVDTWALRDGFFQLMQAATDLTFGSVHVIQMLRSTSVPLGADSNQRFEYADNFTVDVDYPATTLRPVGGNY